MSENTFLVPQVKQESLLKRLPCPFSPNGMLQPSSLQPPPMFGPRGTTIPPKHLAPYAHRTNGQRRYHAAVNNQKKSNQQDQWNNSSTRQPHKSYDNRRTRSQQPSQQPYQGSREFWCEPCDRDFKSHEMLLEHNSQHQKCGIDGCKFVGHELIVTKHIQMQHSTGLFERLKNLETPEDIMKWREERKKRYPTKANIELRQQIQEERNKRGEKLNDPKSRFGRQSDRKGWNNRSKDNTQTGDMKKEVRKRRRRPNRKNTVSTVEFQEVEDVNNDRNDNDGDADNSGLTRFKGTSLLSDYKKPKGVEPKNVLFNLLGMYGSDSESSDENDTYSSEEKEIEERKLELSSVIPENITTEQSSESEKSLKSNHPDHQLVMQSTDEMDKLQSDIEDLPCEEPIMKREDADNLSSETVTTTAVHRKRSRVSVNERISKKTTILDLSKKYRNQNTMLEKLLQKDIRHERNVLLQCVRHVVNENFFGIGRKPLT